MNVKNIKNILITTVLAVVILVGTVAAAPIPPPATITATPNPTIFRNTITFTGVVDRAPTGRNAPTVTISCYQNGMNTINNSYNGMSVIKNNDGTVSLISDWTPSAFDATRGDAECTVALNLYSPKIKGYETVAVSPTFYIYTVLP